MSLPNFSSARDEVLEMFRAAWEQQTPVVNKGVAVRVEWNGVDAQNPPPGDKPYATIVVRHTDGDQRSLGTVGNRRFGNLGLITVQCFAPLSEGGGLLLAENLSMIARDVYRGRSTETGIWFRRVTIREIGPSDSWYQFNMVAEFQYDEVL